MRFCFVWVSVRVDVCSIRLSVNPHPCDSRLCIVCFEHFSSTFSVILCVQWHKRRRERIAHRLQRNEKNKLKNKTTNKCGKMKTRKIENERWKLENGTIWFIQCIFGICTGCTWAYISWKLANNNSNTYQKNVYT